MPRKYVQFVSMGNIVIMAAHGPIVDPHIYAELNSDQIINLEILKNQTLTKEFK